MVLMKIKTVTFGDSSVGYVTFEAKPEVKIKVWKSAPFKDALVVGAEAEATFRTEPAKGTYPESKWLASWGGVAEAAEKKFSGGGGGFKSTPKSPQEIHSASIAGIIKSCIEHSLPPSDVDAWVDAYNRSIKKVAV